MENNKEFLIGCNYWASNAGCFTWKNFDADVIKKDVEFLAEYGVNCLRIFPTWEDFQPIQHIQIPVSPYFDKQPFRIRVNEKPLLKQKFASGLSEEKLEQFKFLLDCAKDNNMKVIVSFLTGWMSGRYFIPDALKGKNLITDPECIIYECMFIKDMISELKGYDNIIAWEPGNECNCLSYQVTKEQCKLWMMTICNAIRVADPTRPIYSGLYTANFQNAWNLLDQSEYFDVLTTHPYPAFTEFCNIEDIRQMRASLHSACETHLYGSTSNKTCMVEEINSLGSTIISDKFLPEFFDRAIFTSYSVGTNGFLWWCGFEQDKLNFHPYDTNTLERNLGLAYADYTPKEVIKSFKKCKQKIDKIGKLPKPQTNGVVYIPAYNNAWKNAYGAFMLAVQSGNMVDFCYEEQPLKQSSHYIVPSIVCSAGLTLIAFNELKEKIINGSSVLLTLNGGSITELESFLGLDLVGYEKRRVTKTFTVNGKKATVSANANYIFEPNTAKVLLRDDDGQVLLSVNEYGKGKVYLLTVPIEDFYTESYLPENTPLYEIYKLFFNDSEKIFSIDSSRCMVNIHQLENGKVGVTINNYEKSNTLDFVLKDDYKLDRVLFAKVDNNQIVLEDNFAYLELVKL